MSFSPKKEAKLFIEKRCLECNFFGPDNLLNCRLPALEAGGVLELILKMTELNLTGDTISGGRSPPAGNHGRSKEEF
jgi:hypothetical protein